MRPAPCSLLPAPAPCALLPAPCSVRRPVPRSPCSVRLAPCSLIRRPCSVLPKRSNRQPVCGVCSGHASIPNASTPNASCRHLWTRSSLQPCHAWDDGAAGSEWAPITYNPPSTCTTPPAPPPPLAQRQLAPDCNAVGCGACRFASGIAGISSQQLAADMPAAHGSGSQPGMRFEAACASARPEARPRWH